MLGAELNYVGKPAKSWQYVLLMIQSDDGIGSCQLSVSRRDIFSKVTVLGSETKNSGLPQSEAKPEILAWYADSHSPVFPIAKFRSENSVVSGNYRTDYGFGGETLSLGFVDDEVTLSVATPNFSVNLQGVRRFSEQSGVATKISSKLFSARSIRRFEFEGIFDFRGKRSRLSGIGYLQDVTLQGPLFPWHWQYVVFANGTTVAVSQLYVGFNSFRRGMSLWHDAIENLCFPLMSRGYLICGATGKMIRFDKVKILVRRETSNGKVRATFVQARDKLGNYINWSADVTDSIEMEFRGTKFFSRYHYRSMRGAVRSLVGLADGKAIDLETSGPGFANIEFTDGWLI